jgi:hypothetical protein
MYTLDGFLVPNAAQRYAIGSTHPPLGAGLRQRHRRRTARPADGAERELAPRAGGAVPDVPPHLPPHGGRPDRELEAAPD